MVRTGETLAGRYRIDETIGAGGMATVHRASDLLLHRRVAVKVLAPNLVRDRVVRDRFLREARAMAAVAHPTIVGIYDVGDGSTDDDPPFLVMELVEGETLAEQLARDGPIEPRALGEIVEGLADALEALHRAGVVHRDVKPQNVLLTPSGPKLADLGIVHLEDPRETDALTATGTTLGTFRYMAPEQLEGQPAGPKTDAYALALVAYEALTGRPGRSARSISELALAAQQPIAPVSTVRPDFGTSFDPLFQQALAEDPASRPGPTDFARSLREATEAWSPAPRPAAPAPMPMDASAETAASAPVPAAARPRRRNEMLALAVLIAVAAVIAAFVLLNAGAAPGGIAQESPSPVVPSPVAEEKPSPTASPPAASEPATVPPSNAQVDDALASLREAARGLEPDQVGDFNKRVDEVADAIGNEGQDKALEKARELRNRVDELIREGKVSESGIEPLRESADSLVAAIEQ
jgi:serine/threonine-protein kinase